MVPAIHPKDAKCVPLQQGDMDASTTFGEDPAAMARRWLDAGARRLHLVDLNGAFAGEPVNGAVVTAIAAAYPDLPIQIGGGIRNLETIEFYIKAGVSYVIIGTAAVKNPGTLAALVAGMEGFGHILAPATASAKNLMPRIAALRIEMEAMCIDDAPPSQLLEPLHRLVFVQWRCLESRQCRRGYFLNQVVQFDDRQQVFTGDAADETA